MEPARVQQDRRPFTVVTESASPATRPPRHSSLVAGSLWMIGLTVGLFFMPVVNGLVGGLVGGYKVGTVRRAMLAAILPAVVVAVALWALLIAFNMPFLGLFAGVAVGALIVLSELGIFFGAAVGGYFRQNKAPPSQTA